MLGIHFDILLFAIQICVRLRKGNCLPGSKTSNIHSKPPDLEDRNYSKTMDPTDHSSDEFVFGKGIHNRRGAYCPCLFMQGNIGGGNPG